MGQMRTLTINGRTFTVVSPTPIASVILPSSAWIGEASPYSQVASVPGATKNSQVNLTPTVEQNAIFSEKHITFTTKNEGGTVTIYVFGQKPTNDYIIPADLVEVDNAGSVIYGITIATPLDPDKFPSGTVTDEQLANVVDAYAKQHFSLGFGADGKLYIIVAGVAVGDGVEINGSVTPNEGVAVFVADFSGGSPSADQFYTWEGRDYSGAVYDALTNIQCVEGVAKLTSVYDSSKSKWITQMMTTGGLFESDNFICKFRAKFCGLAGSWNNVITYGTGTHWTNGTYSDGVKWPAGGEIDAFEQAGGYRETPTGITHTAHWGAGTLSGYPNAHQVLNNGESTEITTGEWHDFKFSLKNGYVICWIDDVQVSEFDLSECTVSNNYLRDYKPFLKPQAFYIDGSCASGDSATDKANVYEFEVSDFAIYQDANVECTGLEIYPQMWAKGTNLVFPVGAEVYLDRVYTPANVSNKACTWVSSNPSVATVVQGFVKVLAAGTTTITAECGNATAQYTLTAAANANVPCAKITSEGTLSGTVGDTIDIAEYLKLYPSFTTDEIVVTANNSNVTINGTVVSLVTDGDTVLTVTVGTKAVNIPLSIEGQAVTLMLEHDFISDGAVAATTTTETVTWAADNTYSLHYKVEINPKYGTGTRNIKTDMLDGSTSRIPWLVYDASNNVEISVGNAVACYTGQVVAGDWITIVFTATQSATAKVYINGEHVKDYNTTFTDYMYIGKELKVRQSILNDSVQYCTGRIEIYRGDNHELHNV